MGKRVIILGGGVGGMSAAHELAERDFEVTVYETRPIAGGKARSVSVPSSGTGGRGITYPNPNEASNLEPLLINTAGSWSDRPDAVTAIENLFLVSDYVRTHTDLATMEGADEAARRAVNGILDACGSSAPRCGIWPLEEPAIFAPARAIDRIRLELGRPPMELVRIRDGRVDAFTAPVGQRPRRRAGGPPAEAVIV